jgi:phage tail sheath gpL-like
MPLPFANIPANLLTPLFYVEVSPALANTETAAQVALVVGQITASGVATPNIPIRCQGVQDAKTQGGAGSMLALEAAAYYAGDPAGELWLLPVADAAGATAATGSISFTGTATAPGTLAFYVAGQLVQVGVTSGMTAAQLATALVSQIGLQPDLPVTATVDATHNYQVDFTAKNKGQDAGDIDLRLNYHGAAGGEVLPAGITATITAMSGGATNPTLTTALANLVDKPFDFICNPYTDATSTSAFTALMSDANGRWSWQAQLFGHVWGFKRGSYATLGTFGSGLNDQHSSYPGLYDAPNPTWQCAAAVMGVEAASLKVDPAQPLQTLTIPGILAPPLQSRFTLSQRNALLIDGISTFKVQSGVLQVETAVTTYETNSQGAPDNSYRYVETMFTLMAVIRALSGMVASRYARSKLAVDGTPIAPGSNIVTPSIVRGDLIALYQKLEAQGLVENSALFAQGLVVQINAANPSRLDVLFDPDLIQGLRVFAGLVQFRNGQ